MNEICSLVCLFRNYVYVFLEFKIVSMVTPRSLVDPLYCSVLDPTWDGWHKS